jgi:formate-dependent nitrite reductase cytochrome c552 subunit
MMTIAEAAKMVADHKHEDAHARILGQEAVSPGSHERLEVALEMLGRILDLADDGMTKLQTGEAERGTSSLVKIKDMARDGIRLAEVPPQH